MKTIYKYAVDIVDEVTVWMPLGAKVLHLDIQYNMPTLWAEVDNTQPSQPVKFRWFGTGHLMPEGLGPYVGTIQIQGGALVFHLYKATP